MSLVEAKLTEAARKNAEIVQPTDDAYPWQSLNLDLKEVNPIRSMITADESFYLHWLGRDYYQGIGEIVDGGPLLGGSTMALASGLAHNSRVSNKRKRIHSYDLFTYFPGFESSVLPGANLKEGDSLLPFFLQNTRKYEDYIRVTPGDVMNSHWHGAPIEILFVDLAKSWTINNHVIKEFFGCLIPNRSIVVQQDYFHYYCYWLHLTMQHFSPYFRISYAPSGGTLAFILTEEIPKELLEIDYSKYFTKEQAIQLMDAAIAPLQGPWKLLVMTAKIRLLADLKEYELACSLAQEIRASVDWVDWILYDVVEAETYIPAYLLFPGIDRKQLIGVSRNYNLLYNGETVYAVPHALGQFAQQQNHSAPLQAKTLPEIKVLIDEAIHPLGEVLPPMLLDSYKGYNLIQYDYQIYALPISLGPIDVTKEDNRHHPEIVSAETLQELKAMLDMLESYKGYSFAQHNGQIYAIPLSLSEVDLSQEAERCQPGIIGAETIPQAKELIDQASLFSPRLLGTYKHYNLVDYNRCIYSLPVSLGHVNLNQEEDRRRPGIIITDTLPQAKNLIDQAVASISDTPIFHKSYDSIASESPKNLRSSSSNALPTLARKVLSHYRHGGMRALTNQTLKFIKERLRAI